MRIGEQCVAFSTGVKTVAIIDVNLTKLNVKDVDIIGIGKAAVVFILLQYISEYRIIDIPNFGVKLLPANAFGAIVGMDRIWIQMGITAAAVVYRII